MGNVLRRATCGTDPDDWASFRKSGNPTNANAWGGHADAADKDRHLGHISIIYDMLLPYILSHGAIGDDNSGIAESGNGIPDILDEARFEVDFWLRLRDGKEFSHGLTNPNAKNEFFQAGTTAMAAWANAANAAMLADAFRIAGKTALAEQYRAAAIEAYGVANAAADPMLDKTMDAGDTKLRGRDLKLTAAAFLYNVTGDQTYEAVVQSESVCTTATSEILNSGRNQLWGTAGYLMTPQTVHFQSLWDNMKASIDLPGQEGRDRATWTRRPSRRATNEAAGYFRTVQNVHHTLIAHAVTTDATREGAASARRSRSRPTGAWAATRPTSSRWAPPPRRSSRSGACSQMYTAGRDDGVPGTTPGQTPYCNLDDWDTSMTMGSPSKLYKDGYPADFKNTWPIGEACFDTPWVWAHNEFTPQQTMRGKTALYGYLYGLSPGGTPTGTGGSSGGIDGGPIGSGGAIGSGGVSGSGGRTTGGSGGTVAGSGGQVGSGGAAGVGGSGGSTGGGNASSSGCGCAVGGPSGRSGAGALMALLALAFLASHAAQPCQRRKGFTTESAEGAGRADGTGDDCPCGWPIALSQGKGSGVRSEPLPSLPALCALRSLW